MLGRFFFIGLLLIGGAAVALFATRSGYSVGQRDDGTGIVCRYWVGFGLREQRYGIPDETERARFECPLILRDIVL